MQALQISAARHLNRAYAKRAGLTTPRRGEVFGDRYNEEVITNRRQARHAWGYVLNNWRKHGEQRAAALRAFTIDPFSSAIAFDGWTEPIDEHWPPTYEPLPVHAPRSWLLSVGWRLYGLIDPREIPGARSRRTRTRASARSDARSVVRIGYVSLSTSGGTQGMERGREHAERPHAREP